MSYMTSMTSYFPYISIFRYWTKPHSWVLSWVCASVGYILFYRWHLLLWLAQKAESFSKDFMILACVVLIQCQRVTVRQTDRQTNGRTDGHADGYCSDMLGWPFVKTNHTVYVRRCFQICCRRRYRSVGFLMSTMASGISSRVIATRRSRSRQNTSRSLSWESLSVRASTGAPVTTNSSPSTSTAGAYCRCITSGKIGTVDAVDDLCGSRRGILLPSSPLLKTLCSWNFDAFCHIPKINIRISVLFVDRCRSDLLGIMSSRLELVEYSK